MLCEVIPGYFIQFTAHNINIPEETLNSKGTFHATQMAAFQRNHINFKQQTSDLQIVHDPQLLCFPQLHKLQPAPSLKL